MKDKKKKSTEEDQKKRATNLYYTSRSEFIKESVRLRIKRMRLFEDEFMQIAAFILVSR